LKRVRVTIAYLLSILLFAALTNSAYAQSTVPSDSLIEIRKKANGDPTLLVPHIALENDYTDQVNDSWRNVTSLDGYYVFAHNAGSKWGANLKVPLSFLGPGSDTTKTKAGGLGDINLSVSYSRRLSSQSSNRYRLLFALGATMNTATDSELGKGTWVLSPKVSFSTRLNSHFNLVVGTGYSRSVHTATDGTVMNHLGFGAGFVASNRGGWFSSLSYKGGVDFEKGNAYKSDIAIEVGNLFTRKRNTSFHVNFKLPIKNDKTNYTLMAGIKHHF
jgi:hypothetical protein